jgi:uncharacterized protein YraI
MNLSNIVKTVGLSGAVLALTAGAAFAAVATSSVNVRTGPGTGYSVIDTLRPGEFVDITGQSGGWCNVAKSGPNGWVSCAYLADAGVRFNAGVPSVTLRFGTSPDRYYRPYRPSMHWNGPGRWDRPGSSFGLSFSN